MFVSVGVKLGVSEFIKVGTKEIDSVMFVVGDVLGAFDGVLIIQRSKTHTPPLPLH